MQVSRTRKTILIADDEPEVRTYFETALQCQGYSTLLAEDGEEVINYITGANCEVAAVLLDLIMPRKDGLETLRELRRIDKDLPIIVISGVATPINVAELMRCGATDFMNKPVDHSELNQALQRVIASNSWPADRTVKPMRKLTFFGTSARMRQIHNSIPQIGGSDAPVLILGETGAGKEVLARELHAHSPRANRPFLKLNCAALPSELVESELFGYERGAFTGAFQRKPGMFELADGGTLMLDEIGDMDYRLQAKLLQVLQDREFPRLGGKEMVRVDVRIIAATHRDLENAIVNKAFREDLYYRLNIITIHVPGLRECKEDILPLAEFLMKKHLNSAAPVPFIPGLRQAMLNYSWPGNVRELENVVRKMLILRDPESVAADLNGRAARLSKTASPATASTPPAETAHTQAQAAAPAPGGSTLEEVWQAQKQAEVAAIVSVLERTHWNRKRAASLLNIDYKALLYKMKKLGIDSTGHPEGVSTSNERTATARM